MFIREKIVFDDKATLNLHSLNACKHLCTNYDTRIMHTWSDSILQIVLYSQSRDFDIAFIAYCIVCENTFQLL